MDPKPNVAPLIAVAGIPVEVRYRVNGINIEGSDVTLSDTFGRLA